MLTSTLSKKRERYLSSRVLEISLKRVLRYQVSPEKIFIKLISVLATSILVAIAGKEISGIAETKKTGENGENSKNEDKNWTNLAQVLYIQCLITF